MIYKCNKCKKEFKQKICYDKHINKKKLCEIKNIKYIDLFCGIGGFHQALNRLNSECVFACDIDKNCRKNYEKNYKMKPYDDITKINVDDIPEYDILCAGFPCQTFSNAGKKKSFEDKRGLLFDEIIKIINKKKT